MWKSVSPGRSAVAELIGLPQVRQKHRVTPAELRKTPGLSPCQRQALSGSVKTAATGAEVARRQLSQ